MTIKRFEAIEGRLGELEKKMTDHITATAQQYNTLKSEMQIAVDNSAEILAVLTAAKKVGGIAVKHWKTAIVFGAGVMSAAGFGNPEVLGFIKTFFGG